MYNLVRKQVVWVFGFCVFFFLMLLGGFRFVLGKLNEIHVTPSRKLN